MYVCMYACMSRLCMSLCMYIHMHASLQSLQCLYSIYSASLCAVFARDKVWWAGIVHVQSQMKHSKAGNSASTLLPATWRWRVRIPQGPCATPASELLARGITTSFFGNCAEYYIVVNTCCSLLLFLAMLLLRFCLEGPSFVSTRFTQTVEWGLVRDGLLCREQH